jgi:hypothetical protein
VEREYLNLHGTFFSCFKFFLSFSMSRQWAWGCSDSSLFSFDVLLQAEDTEEPADEADELSEMIELGRRDDFTSGKVPTKELRNFGAVTEDSGRSFFYCLLHISLRFLDFSPLPSCEKLIERSLI